MNVLVTGGTGFIGHNLVLDLLESTDWDFTVIDSFSYSGDPAKLVESPRFDPGRVVVVQHDLTRPLEGLHLKGGGRDPLPFPPPDVIFNLASESHVDNSIKDPAFFFTSNVAIIVNVLEYARVVKPRIVIQMSTDEVYGPAPQGVNFAEWSTILPSNPYSGSKACQESVATSYWRTYGVPVVIVNSMNVIGPGQHPEKFIPMVVEKVLAELPVPVHAEYIYDHEPAFCVLCQQARHGEENGHRSGSWEAGSRFYIHVSNVSSALKFITEGTSPALYPDSDRPDRYNIVGDREVANDEMVSLIAGVLGNKPLIKYVDFHGERPGHDRRYALDGSKLAALGWRASVSFEDGLRTAVEAIQQELEVTHG